jgi:beta-N-acetylhexosaminidase
VATGELRDRLGFQGVSITDALGGAAARAFGGPARTASAAARAGTDLVLFTDLASAAKAQRSLAAGLSDGTIPRTEFQTSVDRILALRGRPGRTG